MHAHTRNRYTKGGKTQRALELCFRAQLFDSLREISDDLDTDTDPALLTKCADFFMVRRLATPSLKEHLVIILASPPSKKEKKTLSNLATPLAKSLMRSVSFTLFFLCHGRHAQDHQQYDKAVHLYITAQKYQKALELCLR